MVSYELLHSMKNINKEGLHPSFKLHMSKTYDTVEWRFLEAMLESWDSMLDGFRY